MQAAGGKKMKQRKAAYSIRPNAELPVRAFPHRGAGDSVRIIYHQGAIWGGFVAPVLTYWPCR
jgi:hypothetical protein